MKILLFEPFFFTCLLVANDDDDCVPVVPSSSIDKEIEDDIDKVEFDGIVIGGDILGTRFVVKEVVQVYFNQ
jgi:hypothetical protein